MTRVEVLTGVSDPVVYACKFLRKSQTLPAVRHMVCGPQDLLKRLDQQLWVFDAHSFIAHAWAEPSSAVPEAVRQRTPIWLGAQPEAALACTVLVNLHDGPPEGWARFERVVEFVGTEPEQVAAGRRRWKAYGQQAGVERVHHAVGGAT
jgi:DNA polymerase III subunit chi